MNKKRATIYSITRINRTLKKIQYWLKFLKVYIKKLNKKQRRFKT